MASMLNVLCSQVKPSGLEVAIDVAEFDEQWQRVAGQQFNLQNTLFVPHDFAVSPSYYIFFYTGSRFDLVKPRTTCSCKSVLCTDGRGSDSVAGLTS